VVRFDTASCGEIREALLLMHNRGDEASTVSALELPSSPFSISSQVPFVLEPGESRNISLGYAPTQAPLRDSTKLRIIADNNVASSIALLCDVSDAMTQTFSGADSRIAAAHDALRTFVNAAMSIPDVHVEIGSFSFRESNQFRILRLMTTDRSSILAGIPSTASGSHACIWDALHRAMGFVHTSQLRRVVVLITASPDAGRSLCGTISSAGVTSTALANNTVICAISFDNAESETLSQIAAATGGYHASVSDTEELNEAVASLINALRTQAPTSVSLHGDAVSPLPRIERPVVLFPAVATSDTASARIHIGNDGTSALHMYAFERSADDIIVPPLPPAVLPGDSVALSIGVHPSEGGFESRHITVRTNTCLVDTTRIRLFSVGIAPGGIASGPVAYMEADSIHFGQVHCASVDTRELRFINDGVTAITVENSDITVGNFHLSLPTTLAPGEEGVVSIRFSPDAWLGIDSVVASIPVSSRRQSASTVLLLERSPELAELFDQALRYIDVVSIGRDVLVSTMLHRAGIMDKTSVMSASQDGIESTAMTSDAKLLCGIALTPGGAGNAGNALMQALDTLGRYGDNSRLLMFGTKGDAAYTSDTGPFISDIAAAALGVGTKISVMLLSTAEADSLSWLCDQTGGSLRRISTLSNFLGSLDEFDKELYAPGTYEIQLIAESITPVIRLDATVLSLGDLIADSESSTSVLITNPSQFPLRIDSATTSMSNLRLSPNPPFIVPPGQEQTVILAVIARSLGVFDHELHVHHNTCPVSVSTIRLFGQVRDSMHVSLPGVRHVKPGSVVHIPVIAEKAIIDAHELRSFELSVEYNPTLLYPDLVKPALLNGTSHYSMDVRQSFDTAAAKAVSTYSIQVDEHAPSIQAAYGEAFCTLRMHAFLGNRRSTDITVRNILSASPWLEFASGDGGIVMIDSFHYIDQRLIDPSILYGVSLGKPSPNPTRSATTVIVYIPQRMHATLRIYTALGQHMHTVADALWDAGSHSVRIDVTGFPPGVYYCRLESAGGVAVERFSVIH